jgi:glutathione peroxidase
MFRSLLTLGITLGSRFSSTAAAAGTCAHDAVPGALLKFRGLAGAPPISPSALAGKAVLVVNTASYCGYTPQLAALQQLHERYAARGLVVLGVPSNDFGAQEPDAEPAIAQRYAAAPFGVRFPLAAKYAVSGGEAHPFFLHLQHKLGDAGAPHWNFQKYLVGRDGQIAGLFDPSMDPLLPEVLEAVEGALAAAAPAREDL